MKNAFKIAPILAIALGAMAGTSQAAVSPAQVDTGGIKSILRSSQAVPGVQPGAKAPAEKLQMFAGNSSSNSSSNSNSNSSSNSNSNGSSNSNWVRWRR